MLILAIDTSCDETAVAINSNIQILSSAVWSQSTLHASFGGVLPSLAQRQHQARIDWIVNKALVNCKLKIENCDCIAVTIGPGLAIALEVGINKAKELAVKYKKPLIPVNHVEAHLLSPLAVPRSRILDLRSMKFPCFGLILSGGTTVLCLVKAIGDYEILAETADDALGEALDKAARLVGLGYPGGAILEKFAKTGDPKKYRLPLPLQNDVIKNRFSYSGLKTAFVRLFETIKKPTKQDIADLAASFQSTAFDHILKVLEFQIINSSFLTHNLLFGGGVANNIELKKRLRKLCKKYGIKLLVPYTKKLNGDNAAMIGVCAYLKYKNSNLKDFFDYNSVDRNPKLKI
ncbi:MAG: tRNA (adenosine(37)-N6)-threonylcarbamoyltransferase complex transferase subunit TsaD [Patescibacteria group bacterium]